MQQVVYLQITPSQTPAATMKATPAPAPKAPMTTPAPAPKNLAPQAPVNPNATALFAVLQLQGPNLW